HQPVETKRTFIQLIYGYLLVPTSHIRSANIELYIYYLILSLIVFIFGLFKANWQKYEGIVFSETVRIMILDYFLSLEGLTHKNVGGYINCE
ncbi:hypothetical protein OHX05_12275, partial [Acinetobacter baumannii]|nr:hypothetical protein [Acinetobacter baumannii]